MPAPVATWTGCYVNGGVGYGLNNLDHFGFGPTGSNPNETSGGRGYLGTVGGGCDYQFSPASGRGNWVVGAFADYDFMDLHGGLADLATTFTAPDKENWAVAVGGRIGFLVAPSPDLCERRLDLNPVQWRKLSPLGSSCTASTDF